MMATAGEPIPVLTHGWRALFISRLSVAARLQKTSHQDSWIGLHESSRLMVIDRTSCKPCWAVWAISLFHCVGSGWVVCKYARIEARWFTIYHSANWARRLKRIVMYSTAYSRLSCRFMPDAARRVFYYWASVFMYCTVHTHWKCFCTQPLCLFDLWPIVNHSDMKRFETFFMRWLCGKYVQYVQYIQQHIQNVTDSYVGVYYVAHIRKP